MATSTISYGTRTAFGSAANLNSLASGAACALGAIDNTAGNDGFIIDVSIVLGTVAATGTLTIYLIQSSQSTTTGFADGISPTGASVAGSILNAIPIRTLATPNSSGATVADTFRLPVADPAKYWSLVVLNGTGAALAASGHAVDYTSLTYATA